MLARYYYDPSSKTSPSDEIVYDFGNISFKDSINPIIAEGIFAGVCDTKKITIKDDNVSAGTNAQPSIASYKAAFKDCLNLKEIKHIMHESDVTQLVNRSWYYRRGAGGGTLMDLHFHLFNLMNLMGLKMTSVSKSMALKYPYSIDVSILLNRQKSLGELKGTFDRFEQDEAEDAIFVEGIVNYDIPITMQSVRFAPNNTKELLIVGKNNQRIKFLPSSSSQKVQLLSENNKVIAVKK